MSPWQAAETLAIGAGVGLIPGLFGVGGGFVLVPALNIVAGLPPVIAIGSATCQSLGPLTTGLLHRRGGPHGAWRLPWSMFGGALVGLMLGMQFLQWGQQQDALAQAAGARVPPLETLLLSCYLGLLTFLAGVMGLEWRLSRGRAARPRRGWLAWAAVPPLGQFPELDGRSFSIPVLAALAAFYGFLNTGLGMGGGIMLVPALVYLVGVPMHRAVSTSLVLSWGNGLIATGLHAWLGNIDLGFVALLLVGGAAGAKLGSRWGERASGRNLRGWFALLMLVVAAAVAVKLWRLLGAG